MEERYKVFEQNDKIDTMNNVMSYVFLYFRLVTEDSS